MNLSSRVAAAPRLLARCVLLFVVLEHAAVAQRESLEYAVKAAYLFKFAPFIEWPPRTFSDASADFTICIIGADPFGATLEESVKGQRVYDRAIVVRRMAAPAEDAACQIAYAGRGNAQLLQTMRNQAVLTVSEGDGGIINFVQSDDRIRFNVDVAAAQGAGITISSKLLALAVASKRTPQ